MPEGVRGDDVDIRFCPGRFWALAGRQIVPYPGHGGMRSPEPIRAAACCYSMQTEIGFLVRLARA